MSAAKKLELWFNELADHPQIGPYLRMPLIGSKVQSLIEHVGFEASWETLKRSAERLLEIDKQ